MRPFVVPLILLVVAIPMATGLLPKNGLYGFRTALTLSSDEVWKRANKIAGAALLMVAALWLTLLVVLPRVMTSSSAAMDMARTIGRVGLLAAAAISFWLTYRQRVRP